MTQQQMRFDDGAAYEQMMGKWSRLAGDVFLDWLAPAQGLRWVDVGCGNGASTQLVFDRCAPAMLKGIDPSPGQLAFARTRPVAALAEFALGDAMALPFAAGDFDAAIMALVIFFVPDPVKGVAEMVRVVRPGGMVAAYAWDIPGGGFPLEPIQAEMRAFGFEPLRPPQADIARIDALARLWTEAGLINVETREIVVQRDFADFDEFWRICLLSSTIGGAIAAMAPGDVTLLKERVKARLTAGRDGQVSYVARANAVKGTTPPHS
jgi:ubiquinone/menaquinone biosynthesis C-methylase UbiE